MLATVSLVSNSSRLIVKWIALTINDGPVDPGSKNREEQSPHSRTEGLVLQVLVSSGADRHP